MSGETKSIPNSSLNVFTTDPRYRCYITDEYWLITKDDADILRLMRGEFLDDGYALLLIELTYLALKGVRTELRDKWALFSNSYQSEAHELVMQMRATRNRVAQFDFERTGARLKVKEDD